MKLDRPGEKAAKTPATYSPANPVSRLRPLAATAGALALTLFIAGCSLSDDETLPAGTVVPKGLKPLTADQIKTAFGGNSLYSEDKTDAGQGFNAILYHDKSGKVRVRAWGDWGKLTDKGTWQVSAEGHYCSSWEGKLSSRGRECYKIFREDDQVFLVPSGSAGKNRSGTLLPGNYLDS
jgi:hypothetical protein